MKHKKHLSEASSKFLWFWGKHAVIAALQNPQRHCHHVLVTASVFPEIEAFVGKVPTTIVDKKELDARFLDAVHQGIALQVSPLPSLHLQTFCENLPFPALLLVLDHVTDPHNVGALIRTAAVLRIDGVIMTQRHSPTLQGALAKSASGGLEHIPIIAIPNLVQALETLKKNRFWCVGLCEKGTVPLSTQTLDGSLALVMGAEGEGLRRLTQENCDILAFLPTNPQFSTLNVSTAGAIALYEISRGKLVSP